MNRKCGNYEIYEKIVEKNHSGIRTLVDGIKRLDKQESENNSGSFYLIKNTDISVNKKRKQIDISNLIRKI